MNKIRKALGRFVDFCNGKVAERLAPTTHRVTAMSPTLGMSYGGHQIAKGPTEDDEMIALWPDGDWTWLREVEQGSWDWKSDDYQRMTYGQYVEQQARLAVEGDDYGR